MLLSIDTPRWALPLLAPKRYKGARGGRASGKSHFFAELLVEEHIRCPDLQSVCVREVQRSLKHSAKKTIEDKIRRLGVADYFASTEREIRRNGGAGLIIFEGMQDHTADSIKSLEGFGRAWVEEAQNISARSMELLLPTIRQPGSEIWFSWNPENEDDPVEKLFAEADPADAVLVNVNYVDNPWCPDEMRALAEWQRRVDPEKYEHIWMGGFNRVSAAQVLAGKWVVEPFEAERLWDGPYYGADWGFSVDPTALVQFYVDGRRLMIRRELVEVGVETVDLPSFFDRMPQAKGYAIRADSARPEVISHLQQHGYPRVAAASKWAGSIEDGIAWLRGFDQIVIHPDCKVTADEARKWSYKVDRQSGDVLPVLVDRHNHCWDAIRYGAEPMIKRGHGGVFLVRPAAAEPVTRYAQSAGQWVSDPAGALQVWQEPTGTGYVVGAVHALSGAGVSSIQVIDHHTGRQAACWHGRATVAEFSALILSICHRYGSAWAVIDLSAQGPLVVEAVRKAYRRVYSEIPPEAKTGAAPKVRRFGFDGNRSMQVLAVQLAQDCTAGTSGLSDAETIHESGNYVYGQDSAVEIIPGTSHERVLAYCLARHGRNTIQRPAARQGSSVAAAGWGGHI